MSTELAQAHRVPASTNAGQHLTPFAVVCAGLSWIPWAVLGLTGTDVNHGAGALVFALAASGPSLAALVMWLRYRQRMPVRSGRLSWRGPVVAIALGAAPVVLAALCLNAGRLDVIPHHAATVIAGVGGPLGALAYTLISGPLSEEFGWRGYVQPRLRTRFGRLGTVLILGAAWGLWHVPLFLVPGTGQHAIGLWTVRGALFFVSLFPLSCTALFVSEHLRGGVIAAILLHAAWNFTDAVVPPYGAAGAWLQTAGMFAVAGGVALLWRRPRSIGDHAVSRPETHRSWN